MHPAPSDNPGDLPDRIIRPADAVPDGFVMDTNVVLDLWLFCNPGLNALRDALREGRLIWLATLAMLDELGHVRARPFPARHRALPELTQPPALTVAPPLQAAPWRCRDRSDQMFIDLAWQQRCPLLTRDHHLLSLRRKAARLGALIITPEEGLPVLLPRVG